MKNFTKKAISSVFNVEIYVIWKSVLVFFFMHVLLVFFMLVLHWQYTFKSFPCVWCMYFLCESIHTANNFAFHNHAFKYRVMVNMYRICLFACCNISSKHTANGSDMRKIAFRFIRTILVTDTLDWVYLGEVARKTGQDKTG